MKLYNFSIQRSSGNKLFQIANELKPRGKSELFVLSFCPAPANNQYFVFVFPLGLTVQWIVSVVFSIKSNSAGRIDNTVAAAVVHVDWYRPNCSSTNVTTPFPARQSVCGHRAAQNNIAAGSATSKFGPQNARTHVRYTDSTRAIRPRASTINLHAPNINNLYEYIYTIYTASMLVHSPI